MKKLPLILFLWAGALFAQDATVYSTYCIACHGAEGKGLKAANFPPLENSEWVQGDPGRAINIVISGLMGPVTIGEDTYSSMMPGLGATLSDEQIASALNYVRSSFGNKGQKEITVEEVAAVRAKGRAAPWMSSELLELFPLETAAE